MWAWSIGGGGFSGLLWAKKKKHSLEYFLSCFAFLAFGLSLDAHVSPAKGETTSNAAHMSFVIQF